MPSTPGTISARAEHARRLFAGLPGTYDLVAEALSFGQNARWRRFLVARVGPASGGTLLDVATGTAGVGILAASRLGWRVVGVDQSEPMLREGVRRVRAAGLGRRVRLALAEAERLPFPDATFDAVTVTYLLRYVDDPEATLRELVRVLRPGGTLASLEFHVPPHAVARALWVLYTRVGLPVAGRLISPAWGEVGTFLGPSISGYVDAHPLGRQLELWRRAGIAGPRARLMSLGGGAVVWGARG